MMDWINMLELFFGILFTIELVLKVIGTGLNALRDIWNWFDAFIVISWFSQFGYDLKVNPMMLRLLRVSRLVRIIRLVRWIKMFDSLSLLVSSIRASLSTLVWS